jgi:interferon-induced transmembrane protein
VRPRGAEPPGAGRLGDADPCFPRLALSGYVQRHALARRRANWALGVIALPTLLFGVVALCYSAEVGRRFAAGDLTAAARASNRAGAWGTVGLIGDIAILILLARLFI